MYVFFSLMILVGLIRLFAIIFKISQNEKINLLDEMWKNGDINETTYKKYKFEKEIRYGSKRK